MSRKPQSCGTARESGWRTSVGVALAPGARGERAAALRQLVERRRRAPRAAARPSSRSAGRGGAPAARSRAPTRALPTREFGAVPGRRRFGSRARAGASSGSSTSAAHLAPGSRARSGSPPSRSRRGRPSPPRAGGPPRGAGPSRRASGVSGLERAASASARGGARGRRAGSAACPPRSPCRCASRSSRIWPCRAPRS